MQHLQQRQLVGSSGGGCCLGWGVGEESEGEGGNLRLHALMARTVRTAVMGEVAVVVSLSPAGCDPRPALLLRDCASGCSAWPPTSRQAVPARAHTRTHVPATLTAHAQTPAANPVQQARQRAGSCFTMLCPAANQVRLLGST